MCIRDRFLRLPDSHIGYLMFSWVTMGQILCIPMFFLGLYILSIRNAHHHLFLEYPETFIESLGKLTILTTPNDPPIDSP